MLAIIHETGNLKYAGESLGYSMQLRVPLRKCIYVNTFSPYVKKITDYTYVTGRSVVYAPLGLGFRVRVSDRVRVSSVISVSFRVRVRVMVSADIW